MDDNIKFVAHQRVRSLFELARETINQSPSLAQRYVMLARKIAMAAKIRLPQEYRRQICIRCGQFILPGVNCRVRLRQRRESHVVITCFDCEKQSRIPIKRINKENRT